MSSTIAVTPTSIAIALVMLLCFLCQTCHSFSIGNPSNVASSNTNNLDLNLTKKSTALDVLQTLNKSSKLASYVSKSNDQQQQAIAIVTGGASGIGIPTVEALTLAGMKVVLCARNITAAEEVVQNQIPSSLRGSIRIQEMDLASMASIKSATEEIIETDCRGNELQIDVVLNNAGVMAPPKRMPTAQGLELQFGTNHVGHHMFTRLLVPHVNPSGRIVTVASTAHSFGQLDFTNLNYDQHVNDRAYTAWGAYGQSKLANILFAKGLNDELKAAGSDIKSVSLHPGVIGTNLWRYSPKWTRPLLNLLVADKTALQGAATNVYCCLADESTFEGGEYLSDCAITAPNKNGQDETQSLRRKLWDATETSIKENGFSLPVGILGDSK